MLPAPMYFRRLLVGILSLLIGKSAFSYSLENSQWPDGSRVQMQLELGPTSVALQDGSASWDDSAADALSQWNQHIDSVAFVAVKNSSKPKRSGDGYNSVFFSNSVFGDDFGEDVIAVTVLLSGYGDNGETLTKEADVVVNNKYNWNSYDGALEPGAPDTRVYDIHRTLLHEFGHVLGLDHPDDAGQHVSAIMNSVIGDLYYLTQDDINGAIALYGLKSLWSGAISYSVGQTLDFQLPTNAPAFSYQILGLPPGVTIDPHTGRVKGAPTLEGDYSVSIKLTGPHNFYQGHADIQVSDQPAGPALRGELYFSANRFLMDPHRHRLYASVHDPDGIAVIDTVSLAPIKMIPLPHEPFGMALSTDNKKLFVVEQWNDVKNNSLIGVINLDELVSLPDLAVSNETDIFNDIAVGTGNRLFIAATDSIRQIDATTGKSLPGTVHDDDAKSLRMSPDLKTLYAATLYSPAIGLRSYDVSAQTPVLLQSAPPGTADLRSFSLSHDGKNICVPTGDTVTSFSNTNLTKANGKYSIPGVAPHQFGPFANLPVAFSPDDKTLFVPVTEYPDNGTISIVVDLFNVATKKYLRRISTGESGVSDVAIEPSGRYLFVASMYAERIDVYDTGLDKPLHPPTAKSLLNVSTRLNSLTGENALIGGFVISGKVAKTVLVRALGPSLPIAGTLADPVLDLYNGSGKIIASNDNWNADRGAVLFTGVPPGNEHEAALVMTLAPGSYTAVIHGNNSGTGVALFEVYDVTPDGDSTLANISTRGRVDAGDNVMIGGFVVSPDESTEVLVRAIGPSLGKSGIADYLPDPLLELHNSDGDLIAQNDNWRSSQQAAIQASQLAPADNRESAIVATLPSGAYTAIVRGQNGGAGVALVEVYNLDYDNRPQP